MLNAAALHGFDLPGLDAGESGHRQDLMLMTSAMGFRVYKIQGFTLFGDGLIISFTGLIFFCVLFAGWDACDPTGRVLLFQENVSQVTIQGPDFLHF